MRHDGGNSSLRRAVRRLSDLAELGKAAEAETHPKMKGVIEDAARLLSERREA